MKTKITRFLMSFIVIFAMAFSTSVNAQETNKKVNGQMTKEADTSVNETSSMDEKTLLNSPESFSYQAVLRNNSGQLMDNQSVTIDIELIEGSVGGTSVFTESHVVTTNSYGMVSLDIGSINDLSTLNWSMNDYFISVTVNGSHMGTSQLLSVPYAMHASTATTAENANWTDDGSHLYYDSGSDVGIGTNIPVAEFEVLRNNNMTNSQMFLSQDGTGDATLGFYLDGSSSNFGIGMDQSDGSKFKITPSYSISDPNTALTIDQSSQVGIGTSTPETNLHVEGGAKVGANGVVVNEVMEITGTTEANSVVKLISYPAGYDDTNTRVLSAEIKTSASWSDWKSMGATTTGSSGTLYTRTSTDGLYLFYPDDPMYKDKAYRITIMLIE